MARGGIVAAWASELPSSCLSVSTRPVKRGARSPCSPTLFRGLLRDAGGCGWRHLSLAPSPVPGAGAGLGWTVRHWLTVESSGFALQTQGYCWSLSLLARGPQGMCPTVSWWFV